MTTGRARKATIRLLLFLAILLLPLFAHAQPVSPTVTAVLQNSVAVSGAGTTMLVAGYTIVTATITTTGAPTFSVTFQGASSDVPLAPAAFSPTQCAPTAGGNSVSTVSATGSWRCNVTGFTSFQANLTSVTGAGTVRIVATASLVGSIWNRDPSLLLDGLVSGYLKTNGQNVVSSQAVPIPGSDGGTGALNTNFVLGNASTAPAAPITGKTFWFNPTLNSCYGYDGTDWQSCAALGFSIINVKDPRWGAKGDDVTDDTTAIQAALNAVPAAPWGGTIVLLPGGVNNTYKITVTLQLKPNMTLLCPGPVSATLDYTGAGVAVSLDGAVSGQPNTQWWTTIQGCRIKTATGTIGIKTSRVRNVFIRGAYVNGFSTANINFSGDGTATGGTQTSLVQDTWVQGGGDGIRLDAQVSNGNKLDNVNCSAVGGSCINLVSSGTGLISDTSIVNLVGGTSTTGGPIIKLAQSVGVDISGYAENSNSVTPQQCILGVTGGAGTFIGGVSIHGFYCSTTATSAIEFQTAQGLDVSGVWINGQVTNVVLATTPGAITNYRISSASGTPVPTNTFRDGAAGTQYTAKFVTDGGAFTAAPMVPLTGLLLGNGSTSAITAYAGTTCTNQFPRSLNASGVATCASVNANTDMTGTVLNSGIVTSSLTALGTITIGVWQGSSIATGFTDAKVVSVSCTTITCSGTNPASFSVGTAAITPVKGGLGLDTSASSGIPSVNAGTWTINNVLAATQVLVANTGNTVTSNANFVWDGTRLGVGVTPAVVTAQRVLQTTDYLIFGQSGADVALNRATMRWTGSGYAAPSALNTDSTGDKLVFYNSASAKLAIGIDGSGDLWQQATTALIFYIGTAEAGRFSVNGITLAPVTFASLPVATDGTTTFCSDCNATCTAGAGTGRICFRENGAWTH